MLPGSFLINFIYGEKYDLPLIESVKNVIKIKLVKKM